MLPVTIGLVLFSLFFATAPGRLVHAAATSSAATDQDLAQIHIQDENGKPLSGATVTIQVVPQGSTLSPNVVSDDPSAPPLPSQSKPAIVGTGYTDEQGTVQSTLTPPDLSDTTLA